MQDSHGHEIEDRDRKAYAAGWRVWHSGSRDALERADDRGARAAWYDGYADANLADQGGHKWMSLRCSAAIDTWEGRGESACTCDTCNRVRVDDGREPLHTAAEAAVEMIEAAAEWDTDPGSEAGEAAEAAAVEASASPSPMSFARVEVSFDRGQAAPVSRREMGYALAAIRAGFEADGFARTWERNPYGETVARVVAGGWADSVRLDRMQRRVREAVAEIGFPRVALTVDGERHPVWVSTLS